MAREMTPEMKKEWTDFWPEWVPEKVRDQIEDFWIWHGGHKSWLRDVEAQGAPEFGAVVTLSGLGRGKTHTGRFVHAWNNMGRVVPDDGTYECVSFSPVRRGVKKMTYDEWIAEGTRRFGDDTNMWRFVCVSCGHVQAIKDFLDIGQTEPAAKDHVYSSCIGRYAPQVSKGRGRAKKLVPSIGCDWTLGGLFNIAKLVVTKDGANIPVFEFADV